MEITAQELEQKIENGEKVIVEMWAPWCGPCQMMKPIFEKVIWVFIYKSIIPQRTPVFKCPCACSSSVLIPQLQLL